MDVLVAVAHPDDEWLGVGGTIARHVRAGDTVRIHIACTKGLRDRDARVGDAHRMAAALGATVTFGDAAQLGYRVPAIPEADVIYTHWWDLNRDHRLVAEGALVAGRFARSVYQFETPSSTEWSDRPFVPTRFVGIDIDAKLALAELYETELRDYPHPRSVTAIYALAKWRGSTCGRDAAEAFVVVRETL